MSRIVTGPSLSTAEVTISGRSAITFSTDRNDAGAAMLMATMPPIHRPKRNTASRRERRETVELILSPP
jgi:hypothetical protein